MNFQISGKQVLVRGGEHFSESCSPRKMMQNGMDKIFWGRTFKNTSYFNLRTLEHSLALQFSAFEKCIFHFCTIRLKPVALQVFTAPHIFGSPLTCGYVAQGCLPLTRGAQGCFLSRKKDSHISGSP